MRKPYVKIDLSNYFMTPSGDMLTTFLDRYGLTEAPYNKLFQNYFYEVKTNELSQKNLGLLPGAPISAFLANAYLKPFDDYMSETYPVYFRYSDDFVVECGNFSPEQAISDISSQLMNLGLTVNSKKTTVFYPGDKPLFLGSEFSKEGYELSGKRLLKIKKIIKRIADKAVKEKLSADDRVKLFLKKVYTYFF